MTVTLCLDARPSSPAQRAALAAPCARTRGGLGAGRLQLPAQRGAVERLNNELNKALGARIRTVQVKRGEINVAINMISQTEDAFTYIDFTVNSAGITRDNLIRRMKEEGWDSVIDTNLKGTAASFLRQIVITPKMMSASDVRIVYRFHAMCRIRPRALDCRRLYI